MHACMSYIYAHYACMDVWTCIYTDGGGTCAHSVCMKAAKSYSCIIQVLITQKQKNIERMSPMAYTLQYLSYNTSYCTPIQILFSYIDYVWLYADLICSTVSSRVFCRESCTASITSTSCTIKSTV